MDRGYDSEVTGNGNSDHTRITISSAQLLWEDAGTGMLCITTGILLMLVNAWLMMMYRR